VFAETLEALAKHLRNCGLNAYLDPADVSPPGVVVRGDAVLPSTAKLCGATPLRATVWLVVPDTTQLAAYRALDDLYGRVLANLRPVATLTADDRTFERLVMPDDPTGLPALRLTVITTMPAPTAPAPSTVSTGRNTP
jgi:hypothetical protein